MDNNLARQKMLEIYEDKTNFGKLKDKTHTLIHKNPSCEDEIVIELKIEKGKIIDAKFHSTHCFVSTVCGSVLTEKIKGMTVQQAKNLTKKDLDKFLGFDISASRLRCQLLPLDALKNINTGKDNVKN